MAAIATYTAAGAKATTPAKLDKAVFGVSPENHALLKDAYVMYLANGRDNLAVTKTRGLVRGGGRKPWKQKGTGRARFGSTRNPIWAGGGIAFGPTGRENYSKQMNAKAKRLAARQALSLAADSDKIVIIDDLASKDGKTAIMAKLLNKIGAEGSVLLVVNEKSDMLVRACKNIPGVKLVGAHYVNVYDTMNADKIVFTKKALADVTARLSGTAPKATQPEPKQAKEESNV